MEFPLTFCRFRMLFSSPPFEQLFVHFWIAFLTIQIDRNFIKPEVTLPVSKYQGVLLPEIWHNKNHLPQHSIWAYINNLAEHHNKVMRPTDQ